VDEHAPALGLFPDQATRGLVAAGVDHHADALERTGHELDSALDVCARAPQAGDLLVCQRALADHEAALAAQVQEERVVLHACTGALRSTSATSGRVNSTGSGAPSARSSRTRVP